MDYNQLMIYNIYIYIYISTTWWRTTYWSSTRVNIHQLSGMSLQYQPEFRKRLHRKQVTISNQWIFLGQSFFLKPPFCKLKISMFMVNSQVSRLINSQISGEVPSGKWTKNDPGSHRGCFRRPVSTKHGSQFSLVLITIVTIVYGTHITNYTYCGFC